MQPTQAEIDAFTQTNKALLEHVGKRAVAFLTFEDRDNPHVCSGVPIQIAGRCFIATAAHNLIGVSKSDISFVRPNRSGHISSILNMGLRGGNLGQALDVAWIELPQEEADALGKEFIAPGRLERAPESLSGEAALLAGAPAAAIPASAIERRDLPIRIMAYLTHVVAPRLPQKTPVDPAIDLFIDYPSMKGLSIDGGTAVDTPAPHGVSGGGVWRVNMGKGMLWSPEQASLIAIEHTYDGIDQLRCSRIEHWAQMVSEDLPELAPALAGFLGSTSN